MGVIYYGVDAEDLISLDKFESYEYDKVEVEVETVNNKKVKAVVYRYINSANLQN